MLARSSVRYFNYSEAAARPLMDVVFPVYNAHG